MPRPKRNRMIQKPPAFHRFKPQGVPGAMLESITLTLDEYEAIRLADYENLDHNEAAEKMEISRSTFTRLVDRARKKVALFLVQGRELMIEGGSVHFHENLFRCRSCGAMIHTPIGQQPETCPSCGCIDFVDLAGRFGHGRCCHNRGRRGGRQ